MRYKLIVGQNDLATVYPALASEWDAERNGSLTPASVAAKSGREVWWRCSHGHVWLARVYLRAQGSGCPICGGKQVLAGYNDLLSTYPELAKEWHPSRNQPLTPETVTARSNRKVWWQCTCGREWESRIVDRANGSSCPSCSKKRSAAPVMSLRTTHPELAREWHPTKNLPLTPDDITAKTGKKIWWQCKDGHEWEALITLRVKGRNCPYCSGRKVLTGVTDLATLNPELAREWHPSKNGELTGADLSPFSRKRVWWQCGKGHEWQAVVCNRSYGSGCPICSGQMVLAGFNDLASKAPVLAMQWHPTKNGDLTPSTITAFSSKKVWWQCEYGHEWQATVNQRRHGQICPYCRRRKPRV